MPVMQNAPYDDRDDSPLMISIRGNCKPDNTDKNKSLSEDLPISVIESTAQESDDKSKTQIPRGSGFPQIAFLDGLRGLAALLVVSQHASILPGASDGAAGVDMFFALSAFLLTMLLERKIQQLYRTKASWRRWLVTLLDYFSRRFLRVYPLFAILLVVIAFTPDHLQLSLYKIRPKAFNLWKALLFLPHHRYHVLWSLAIEITYYFVIPVFVIGMVALGRRWWIPAVPIYAWLLYQGILGDRSNQDEFYPHLPTFISGSMAAIIYARAKEHMDRSKFQFTWYRVAILRAVEYGSIVLAMSAVFEGLIFSWLIANPFAHLKGPPFISVHVTIVIVSEILLPGPVSSVLEWSLLRFAGRISYSMYLLHYFFVVHVPCIQSQKRYDHFFAVYGASFAISIVTFYLIERPSQAWATKITKYLKSFEVTRVNAS